MRFVKKYFWIKFCFYWIREEVIQITNSDKLSIAYNNGRNSGYIEGYEDGVNTKIEKLTPKPSEIITLFFNMDKMSLEQVSIFFDSIKGKFPNNYIIALPDITNLKDCSKDFLEDMKNIISEIIDNL